MNNPLLEFIHTNLYTSTMGSGLASITWYGEDIMSIVTLGFVVAAISAADLLAEFLKLTLTMILSPTNGQKIIQGFVLYNY